MCQLFMKVSGSLAVYVQILPKKLNFHSFNLIENVAFFNDFYWSIFSLGGELAAAAAAQATTEPHSSRSSPKLNLSNRALRRH